MWSHKNKAQVVSPVESEDFSGNRPGATAPGPPPQKQRQKQKQKLPSESGGWGRALAKELKALAIEQKAAYKRPEGFGWASDTPKRPQTQIEGTDRLAVLWDQAEPN